MSRPRTTSLAAFCWSLLWPCVPTCWRLDSHCRRSASEATTSPQLTTPPSPAFMYSQPGRRTSFSLCLLTVITALFFCDAALQKMLLSGSVSCQMASCWLRRCWQDSLHYTQVGNYSNTQTILTHVVLTIQKIFLYFLIYVFVLLSGDLPQLRPPLSASVEKESVQQYLVVSHSACCVSPHSALQAL